MLFREFIQEYILLQKAERNTDISASIPTFGRNVIDIVSRQKETRF